MAARPALGPQSLQFGRGRVRNVDRQVKPQFFDQLEDQAHLHRGLAVFHVGGELLADAGQGRQVVETNIAAATGGPDGKAEVGYGLQGEDAWLNSYVRRNSKPIDDA